MFVNNERLDLKIFRRSAFPIHRIDSIYELTLLKKRFSLQITFKNKLLTFLILKMASKTSEERPKDFFCTLIISAVVAFIILHTAFLKLTSSPDAISEDKSYPEVSQTQALVKEPSLAEKPAIKEKEYPLIKKETAQVTPAESTAQIKTEFPLDNILSKGYRFHQQGDYKKAADEWAKAIASKQHRNDFTIQLLLACQRDTITRSFKNLGSPEEFFYLKWRHDGRSCYKLCMGLYKSRKEAESKRHHIPKHFLSNGNNPIVVHVSSLVKGPS